VITYTFILQTIALLSVHGKIHFSSRMSHTKDIYGTYQ